MTIQNTLKDERLRIKAAYLASQGFTDSEIANTLDVARTTIVDFIAKRTWKDWWSRNEGLLLGEQQPDEDVTPKISLIDIETSPILGYTWGLFNQNIGLSQIHTDWEIMCACFEWLGKDMGVQTITSRNYWPEQKDRSILEETSLKLWSVLDNADLIVAHNGKRFDNKKIRAKLIQYKLPPPRPYKVVDTLEIAKANFAFTSNKMDYISKYLGGDGKLQTDMQLWIDCINGVQEAWDYMERYCANDIGELKDVYLKTRGWDNKHPNLQMYFDDASKRCGTCGSENVKRVEGQAVTNFSSFDLYLCGDCGAYHRGRHNNRTQTQRSNTLMNIS